MVDEQAEMLITDRISFMNFLDYLHQYPDARNIWLFRERLSKTGKDRIIWNELQRQLELKGIKVKKGSAQDATFITSDPGHVKHDEPRSEGKTRRSKDGSFTKNNNKTIFGYKGKSCTQCHKIFRLNEEEIPQHREKAGGKLCNSGNSTHTH